MFMQKYMGSSNGGNLNFAPIPHPIHEIYMKTTDTNLTPSILPPTHTKTGESIALAAKLQQTTGSINSYNPTHPSKSDRTKQNYLLIASRRISKICSDFQLEHADPLDIAEWMLSRSDSLAPSTIRLYRSSLIYYMQEQVVQGIENPSDVNEAIGILRKVKSNLNTKSNTSSLKAKSVSKRQINTILSRLDSKRSVFAQATSLMFQSSLIAGLRPVEWFSAQLTQSPEDKKENYHRLIVQNAKATNGRSFNSTREILIPSGENSDIIHKTILFLNRLMNAGHTPEKIYKLARSIMLSVSVVHQGKRVSLYTARHQFTANMKNIYSQEEVALLLGHGSKETAQTHYGKRKSGHPEYRQLAKPVKDKFKP